MSYSIKAQKLFRHPRRELGLEIIQLNCHGLFGKLTEFKLYLYREKPDVVCLCETWVRSHEPSFVGYFVLWSHRRNALRGGMAILIRRDIQKQPFDIPPFPGAANLEFQAIKINTALGWIAIANFYNPGRNVGHNEVTHYMTQLGDKFVAVGDFNAHSPLWDSRGRSNMTGRSLESAMETLPICLLNDGS